MLFCVTLDLLQARTLMKKAGQEVPIEVLNNIGVIHFEKGDFEVCAVFLMLVWCQYISPKSLFIYCSYYNFLVIYNSYKIALMFLQFSQLNKVSRMLQVVAYGLRCSTTKQSPMLLMLVLPSFNTRTCSYSIDLKKMVIMWKYHGIRSLCYLTWPDYSNSYMTQKLQAYCTV